MVMVRYCEGALDSLFHGFTCTNIYVKDARHIVVTTNEAKKRENKGRLTK